MINEYETRTSKITYYNKKKKAFLKDFVEFHVYLWVPLKKKRTGALVTKNQYLYVRSIGPGC